MLIEKLAYKIVSAFFSTSRCLLNYSKLSSVKPKFEPSLVYAGIPSAPSKITVFSPNKGFNRSEITSHSADMI